MSKQQSGAKSNPIFTAKEEADQMNIKSRNKFELKRRLRSFYSILAVPVSLINVLKVFRIWAPASSGSYKARSSLTIQTICRFPEILRRFSELDGDFVQLETIEYFTATQMGSKSSGRLNDLLNLHGSDKGNIHGYSFIYEAILKEPSKTKAILEIGLGTNNTDIVSNMGAFGVPGASLRAFRDFCGNARIFGADIDSRVLFSEERIDTFFVDQTDRASIAALGSILPAELDLVIDDGLHSPDANLEILIFALKRLKRKGWVVIEDISLDSIDLWIVISKLLPVSFEGHLIKANRHMLFAAQRL